MSEHGVIRTIVAPNPGPFTLDGTRTYVIGQRTVIDPGPAIDEHVDRILSAAPGLRWIFITHRHGDHAPAAAELKRRSGARVLAPPSVLDEGIVDVRLRDGERFDIAGLSLEVIATPGHTNEHVCFLSSTGELFTGDTILGEGTTAIFPPDGRMSDYLASLEKLRARQPRAIYPGHGPIREDAETWITAYIEHRHMREHQILDGIAAGVRTISALRERIYPKLDERLVQAAELQIEAHLVHMVEKGIVKKNHDVYES